MSKNRLDLDKILRTLCDHIYYSPPATIKMKYPCIVYDLSNARTQFGDNNPYKITNQYLLTVIDEDPDSTIVPKVQLLPMCTFDRHYISDNLNHNVFNLYF